jgi:hypothetical protein
MLMRTPHRWVRPKRHQPPGFIVPCQPTLAAKVPAGDGWIHELKHDGFRVVAFKGDTVRLWSRNGRDWSGEFVAITAAVRELPFKRIMLDGEAVAHCLEVCLTSTNSYATDRRARAYTLSTCSCSKLSTCAGSS